MIDVTVIIPSKDRLDLLRQCVNSLRKHCRGENYEIIVVATGGQEEADWAGREGYTGLWCEGANYAQANNVAATGASGHTLLLLNNDIIVQDDLIGNIRACSHSAMIVGAKLLYPDGLVQHAGVGFDNTGNPYNLWRLAPAEHAEVGGYRYSPAVTFACAFLPSRLWREMHGLDEEFTNAFEDVDFCLRAGERGYKTLFDATITAIHLEGQTAGRHDHDRESWQHFHDKWLATGRLFKALGMFPFSMEGSR